MRLRPQAVKAIRTTRQIRIEASPMRFLMVDGGRRQTGGTVAAFVGEGNRRFHVTHRTTHNIRIDAQWVNAQSEGHYYRRGTSLPIAPTHTARSLAGYWRLNPQIVVNASGYQHGLAAFPDPRIGMAAGQSRSRFEGTSGPSSIEYSYLDDPHGEAAHSSQQTPVDNFRAA